MKKILLICVCMFVLGFTSSVFVLIEGEEMTFSDVCKFYAYGDSMVVSPMNTSKSLFVGTPVISFNKINFIADESFKIASRDVEIEPKDDFYIWLPDQNGNRIRCLLTFNSFTQSIEVTRTNTVSCGQ